MPRLRVSCPPYFMRKFILRFIFCFLVGIVGGILADQILWPYFVERPLFYEYGLEKPPVYVTERKEIRIQENVALQEAIEKVKNSVVGISTQTKTGKVLLGSGIIVTSDGLFVTLSELVPQGAFFSFFVDNKRVPFQVLKRKGDLALIKLDSEETLPTPPFADLKNKKLGERIFLLGKVFEKEGLEKIANEGIIKSLEGSLLKTNIFEQSSLQGSPIFDIKGNFLGLAVINQAGQVSILPNTEIKEFIGF